MIAGMQKNHTGCKVTDLANAMVTKSAEEVTKMFVDSASYILRAAVGGKSGQKGRKASKTNPPLWNPKMLQVDDNFSCISYLKVLKIDGNQVTVQNHQGGQWFISKDLLVRDSFSGSYYDKEVKCTMTDLSQILEACKDTIFKVAFKTKINEKSIEEKLNEIKFASLSNPAELKKISKALAEGHSTEIVGHLVESENHLGRSLVIDLNAPPTNNFRQVDHRTIEYIIFQNVKYTVGKKAADAGELPLKKEKGAPNWSDSKLAVGDWFSSITYYKVRSITDKENVQVTTSKNSKQELTMSRDIMEYEMNSGLVYDKEEKVTRSELVNHLIDAKEAVMTVKFCRKVDDAYVKDVLAAATADQLSDAKKLKALSKELISGKETEMTCHAWGSENKLGRSMVLDLNAPHGTNFRQIDHRTIQSIVLKNTKYVVKA